MDLGLGCEGAQGFGDLYEGFFGLGSGEIERREQSDDLGTARDGENAGFVKSDDGLEGRCFFGGLETRDDFLVLKFDPNHETHAANRFDDVWEFGSEVFKFCMEPSAEPASVIGEAISLNDFEDFEGDGAAERGSAVGCSVGAWPKKILEGFAHPEGTHGEPTAQGFGHGDTIGQKGFSPGHPFERALETLESAGSEMTALNAVDEQEQLFFVAELSQTEEVVGRGGSDAAFALDSFDEDRDGGRGERLVDCVKVIERDMAETGYHGFEALFDFVLTGG